MAQGRQNKGNRGNDVDRGEGEKPEPVEFLIKPRKQASPTPHPGAGDKGNVKRGNTPAGTGAKGGAAVWGGLGLIGVVVAGACVFGAGKIAELESKLGAVSAGGGGGAVGEVEGATGDLAVLTERIASLEKRVLKLGQSGSELPGGEADQGALLKRLEKRVELAALADEAIASGFRSVLRKIDAAVDEASDAEMQQCANAEKARVEIYYLNGAGFFPLPLPEEQDGTPVLEIGTDRLSEYLLVAESPGPLRARAAQLLGRRMETLSADALSESLMLEPDLRVLVHATASFRRVTGCPIPSVFGGPQMREWLTENRELVVARFKDIAEKQAAAREK